MATFTFRRGAARGAVLHDWLCYIRYPKAHRSKLFLAQMLDDDVPGWQAYLQWVAVRFWPGPEAISGEIVPASE
jgi:hypothetical protein